MTEMDNTRMSTWERKKIKKNTWTGGRARNMENKN